VKPDFYSTKVVHSPGFITLVHPQITNKQEYKEQLRKVMHTIKINDNDPVIKKWKQDKDVMEEEEEGTQVPPFHLETSTRKWGRIQTKVLTVHCSKEDANYLKYVLAEAGAKQKLPKGIFVPTGIHLMEGKEVMTQLLQEQQEFLDNVTSLHLGGIHYTEMNEKGKTNESLRSLLMRCEGVKAIEPTNQTMNTGQWIMVIDKKQITQVTEYISENL